MATKPRVLNEQELAKEGWYKGYDVRWLRGETDHPDYHLVAEFDKKYGPKHKHKVVKE